MIEKHQRVADTIIFVLFNFLKKKKCLSFQIKSVILQKILTINVILMLFNVSLLVS